MFIELIRLELQRLVNESIERKLVDKPAILKTD